jgi:hypothetical protein
MADPIEILARENDAEMVRLTGIIFDLLNALKSIAARARFELDHPTEMRDTAFSLIEKEARDAILGRVGTGKEP